MKAYLITTGTVFGAIVVMHGLRLYAEGIRMAKDPIFIALTLLAAGLSVWAWCLLGRKREAERPAGFPVVIHRPPSDQSE